MSAPPSQSVDFLKELRLRRWARENYVPAIRRQDKWHPIVLEEMQRKDDELNQRDDINPGKRFVPLEPMPVRAIHPAHPMPGNPNIRFDDGVPVERHAYTAIGQVESIESDDQLFGLG